MALRTKSLVLLAEQQIELTFVTRYDRQVVDKVSTAKEVVALEATRITIRENEEISLHIKQHDVHRDVVIAFDELRDAVTHSVADGAEKEVSLYQFANNKAFPWPNGKYVYEISVGDDVYYALLHVVSKNITEDEFSNMHVYLESKLQHISVNRDVSAVVLESDHLVKVRQEQIFSWLEENMNALTSILRMIERSHALKYKNVYEIEHMPRHIDRRSIKWENTYKGAMYHGQKYLNRKYKATNKAPENQFVKMNVMKVIDILQGETHFLLGEIDELVRVVDKLEAELAQVTLVSRNVSAVWVNREKYRLEKELEAAQILVSQSSKFVSLLQESKTKLKNIINNHFWHNISYAPGRLHMKITHKNYMAFKRIVAKLYVIEDADDRAANELTMNHILYPTALLYEFYIYFLVIDMLEADGFNQVAVKNGGEMTTNVFGMQPNTTIVLARDDEQMHVVLDQVVDYDSAYAMATERYFYSRSNHRRPDIRMDYYKFDAHFDEYIFQSSLIVEVKYRPFGNIFSSEHFTKEMRQLTEYRAIEYYCPYRAKYQRNVVNEVYCVYPGELEHMAENLEPATYVSLRPSTEADFIQFMQGEIAAWVEKC